MRHDAAYKRLFSHPELVADLLRACITDAWAEDLDYSTLERIETGSIDQSRFLVTRSRDRRHRRRKKTRPSDVP
jgi:hypothetical protein